MMQERSSCDVLQCLGKPRSTSLMKADLEAENRTQNLLNTKSESYHLNRNVHSSFCVSGRTSQMNSLNLSS